jgi:hypothetical protein
LSKKAVIKEKYRRISCRNIQKVIIRGYVKKTSVATRPLITIYLVDAGKDGNIEYGNIEKNNGNIEMGTSRKNNGNIENNIENGNIENNTSIPVMLLGT